MAKHKQNKQRENDELQEAITMLTHSSVCDLYIKVSTIKIICYDIENLSMVYYNEETQLYTGIGIKGLAMKIREELREHLRNINITCYDNIQNSMKLRKNIENKNFIESVAEMVCGMRYEPKIISKMDANKSTVNFKNGILCLKTGKFRERTYKDYVSKCLNYKYSENENSEIHKKIYALLKKICNDNESMVEDNLKWLGYCLTGETKQQMFMATIGHSASNGKSTLIKMFDNAFNIYTEKLNKRTFSKNYSNSHKQFARVKQPIRLAYIEEIDREKLDGDLLKDFVDGYKLNNEIMYGTSEEIHLQCKLNIISNNNLNFDTDEGLKRRGYLQEFHNQFVDPKHKKYNNGNPKAGIYLRDVNLSNMFEKQEFKLAFCQMLIPYSRKYYEEGLTLSETLTNSYYELCEENDKVKEFVEKCYVRTGDNKDRISKDSFLETYRFRTGLKLTSWTWLLNDVKRLGLNYARNLSYKGKQGCILGLRAKDEDEIDYFDDAEEENNIVKKRDIMKELNTFLSDYAKQKKKDVDYFDEDEDSNTKDIMDMFD